MRNVMSHEDTLVQLPERGVVVVTGPNGAGKSSLAEAVALCLWGETLRETPAWRTGERSCFVMVHAGPVAAVRERRGQRVKFSWWPDEGEVEGRALDAALSLGAGATDWESNTQAQAALVKEVGEFDVWRRACTFSVADAAGFTLATDGERKRLLEAILGLDRFDPALEACRRDLRAAELDAAAAQSALDAGAGREDQIRKRLAEAETSLAEVDAEPCDEAAAEHRLEERRRLRHMVDAAAQDARAQHATLRRLDQVGGEHEAEAAALRRRVAALASGRCDACDRLVPDEHLTALRARAAAAAGRYEAARAAASADRASAESALEEYQEELRALRDQAAELEAAEALSAERKLAREAAASRKARAEKSLREASADLAEALAARERQGERLAAARRRIGVLRAVERALGLRGVRAHVLGGALAGINAVAAAWLPKFGQVDGRDLGVELRPHSERAKGGVVDAISIRVTGAGGDHGYKGASAGERKRVDAALLIAISEVSSAAAAYREGSTLWFDELFDGLDAEGRACAVDVLRDLARDRAVVVVTHDAALAQALPAAKRIHVRRGCVVDDRAVDAAGRLGGELQTGGGA